MSTHHEEALREMARNWERDHDELQARIRRLERKPKSEHLDAVRRMITFLREWDSAANNADADLLQELLDELEAR